MTEFVLGHLVVDRCQAFAEQVNRHWAQEQYKNVVTDLAVKINNNIKTQYTGRIAEWAACMFFGGDPKRDLNWIMRPDRGVDFKIGKVTFDIKASDHPHASRLIWPVSKMHLLDRCAHVLLFAKVPPRETIGQVVHLIGGITREGFIANAKRAQGNMGLVDGTMYMDQDQLLTMEELQNLITERNK